MSKWARVWSETRDSLICHWNKYPNAEENLEHGKCHTWDTVHQDSSSHHVMVGAFSEPSEAVRLTPCWGRYYCFSSISLALAESNWMMVFILKQQLPVGQDVTSKASKSGWTEGGPNRYTHVGNHQTHPVKRENILIIPVTKHTLIPPLSLAQKVWMEYLVCLIQTMETMSIIISDAQ